MIKKITLISDGNLIKSRKVKNILNKKFGDSFTVTSYCDMSEKLCGMKMGGVDVISPPELVKLYHEDKIDIVLIIHKSVDAYKLHVLKTIWDFLNENQIHNIYYISDNLLRRDMDKIQKSDVFIKLIYEEHHLDYIEHDITLQCNLSCKGCTRLCDVNKTNYKSDLDVFIKDIHRIKELFNHVRVIRILGGEPFLHPMLGEFIYNTRKILPQSDINIFTNGILINKMNINTMKAIKDNNAHLIITNYKPTMVMRNEIEEYLNINDINYTFDSKIAFAKRMTLHPINDKEKSHGKCDLYNCHMLREGYIYKCLITAYIDRFNKFYKTNITFNEGKYSIYDESVCPKELYDKLKKPIDACEFCNTNLEYFDWEQTTVNTNLSNYAAHYIL